MAFSTPDEVIKFIKDEDVEYVDIRFTDLPGNEQHFTIAATAFDEDMIEEGLAFDGSSIRGSSRSRVRHDAPAGRTARLTPSAGQDVNISCFVHDPYP